jgi:NADPH:quinone reductase-like Zn-dependent oxidoreductase
MKACQFDQTGPPEVLKIRNDVPFPQRGPGEVLIMVNAAGCNPIDAKIRGGKVPFPKLPKVPGGDVAGTVLESDSVDFPVGTKVFGLCQGFRPNVHWGCYAEQVAVKADHLAKIPNSLTFEQAASLPLVSLTAIQALDKASLQPQQKILIHAGSGGVGSHAIQIAKARGLFVITTCSTPNVDYCTNQLGADLVIDYKSHKFEDLLKEQNIAVDCVLDTIAGNYEPRSMSCLKSSGTYISVLAQVKPAAVAIGKIKSWVKLGPKYIVHMVQPSGDDMRRLVDMVEKGQIKPQVGKVMPLEEAAAAHAELETGHTRGKIVLAISGETTGREE